MAGFLLSGKQGGTLTKRLLISACLLGLGCRYDGGQKLQPWTESLLKRFELVPVCPEQLGGLPTPRPPAEIQAGRVMTQEGKDVTQSFHHGAEQTLALAKLFGCQRALLKERSPSCGWGAIYDGSFTGTLCPGEGVCARLLGQNGIQVIGESDISSLLDEEE